jgi:PadR family transcriptional regulator, regulatory protein PadR
MSRELKRGTLEMVLLALLRERERYGYEIVTELEGRSAGAFEMKEGTLYPVLYRLEEAGHVEAHWRTQERGVPRKYYRITPSGEAELGRQVAGWRAFVSVMDVMLGEGGEP